MREPPPLQHAGADRAVSAEQDGSTFPARLASFGLLLVLTGVMLVAVGALAKLYWLLILFGWGLV